MRRKPSLIAGLYSGSIMTANQESLDPGDTRRQSTSRQIE